MYRNLYLYLTRAVQVGWVACAAAITLLGLKGVAESLQPGVGDGLDAGGLGVLGSDHCGEQGEGGQDEELDVRHI